MQAAMNLLESVRDAVRAFYLRIARPLNKMSGGKLKPNDITLFGLGMHLPIALLIARGYHIYAALLLAFFGLFDTLDGALARVQGTTSKSGMLLDSVTDKVKEIVLYLGVGYYFVWTDHAYYAIWAIAACGISLLVSYINAWSEVVTKDMQASDHQTNKSFRANSLMTYDVRMFVLIVGLLVGQLGPTVILIAVLSAGTAIGRVLRVMRYIDHHAKS